MDKKTAKEIREEIVLRTGVDFSLLEVKLMTKVPSVDDDEIYAIAVDRPDATIVARVYRKEDDSIKSVRVDLINYSEN